MYGERTTPEYVKSQNAIRRKHFAIKQKSKCIAEIWFAGRIFGKCKTEKALRILKYEV
jgi:hypothetical protein